eukprot:4317817-Amphidinium_carterae.1
MSSIVESITRCVAACSRSGRKGKGFKGQFDFLQQFGTMTCILNLMLKDYGAHGYCRSSDE